MSAGFASAFQSLLAQPAVLAIGAGVLAGAVTGTALVVTGTLPAAPAAELMLMECPDAGREVAHVKTGVVMLVTGRNAESTWVELYIGVPGIQTGWAAVDNLKVDTAIESLPVVHCVVAPASTLGPPETAGPSAAPTIEPSLAAPSIVATVAPSLGAPSAASSPPIRSPSPRITPTPRPSVEPNPTPSPTPLPPPPTADLKPPIVSNLLITSPNLFNGWYRIYGGQCLPKSATIQVTVADPGGGVASVTLWFKPGALPAVPVSMQPIGGGTWQYVLSVGPTWSDGSEIGLWVRAQDTNDNLSGTLYFGDPNDIGDISLVKDYCLS